MSLSPPLAAQVLKFIGERVAAHTLEDPHASQGPEEVGRMIWQVLGVMVRHEGLLRNPQQQKKPTVRASCKGGYVLKAEL